ncbi:MAG: sulfite exporter TauE/SafE family protein [Candidatus Aminicenantales bacterium]
MEYLKLLLLFGVGSAAGFINVMGGGGSSLTLPALIFLGLDSALANGTNRVAVFIQNISAVGSFRREKVHHFKQSFVYSLFTLPGAVCGALIATRVSDLLFQKILAGVLVLIVFSMFFSYNRRTKSSNSTPVRRHYIYPALFAVGFYGGFIQVGVGFILMGSIYHILRLDLIRVNMHKVFIIMIYTLPVLVVFAATGNINFKFGLVLAAGNAFGAWWGARTAVRGGERVVRFVLAVAIFIMALKLFRIF